MIIEIIRPKSIEIMEVNYILIEEDMVYLDIPTANIPYQNMPDISSRFNIKLKLSKTKNDSIQRIYLINNTKIKLYDKRHKPDV